MTDLGAFLQSTVFSYVQILFDALLLYSLLLLVLDGLAAALYGLMGLDRARLIPLELGVLALLVGIAFGSGAGVGIKQLSWRLLDRVLPENEDVRTLLLTTCALVWFATGLILCCRSLRRYQRMGVLLAQTPGAPADPEWEWALAQSGAGRIPRKELPGRFSPGVYGLRRPVLVLPQFFQEDYSPRERRMIYLHELSHIRRGDPYFHMALQLLKRGFYLHQPLRKQLRRLELYREQCCDRQVLAALRTGPADYGALLLRQMGRCGEDHALSFCGSGFQSAQGRLSALFQESRRQWGKRLACMGCVVLVTLAVSAALPYRDPPSGAYMLIVECRGELEVFPLEQVSQAEAVLSGCPGYEQAALFQPRYLWSGMLGCYTAGDAVPLDCK